MSIQWKQKAKIVIGNLRWDLYLSMTEKQQNLNIEGTEDEQLLKGSNGKESNQQQGGSKLYKSQSCAYEAAMSSFCGHDQPHSKGKTQLYTVIACMILITGLLYFSLHYKQWLAKAISTLDIVQLEKHSNSLNPTGLPDIYKILSAQAKIQHSNDPIYNLCPNSTGLFHTYYNQTDNKMKYIDDEGRKRAHKCNITVMGFQDLKSLRKMWNAKFPEQKIRLSAIPTTQDKEKLLIFLQLYFHAGIYTNIRIPYPMIDDRCWKYALNGFGTLYGDLIEEKDGIYLPDMWTFMKVRYPYSREIREMIERVIKGEDVMEKCRKEQCLIIKCYIKG